MSEPKQTIKEQAKQLENMAGDSLFIPDEMLKVEDEEKPKFDVVRVDKPERKELVQKPDTAQNSADDYDYARKTYIYTIEQAQHALDSILKLAEAGPHPRTFEVAGQLIKVISDNTDKLMKLQKDYKEINRSTADLSQNAEVINNTNVSFNGTLEDLLDELENSEIIDVDTEDQSKE
jgi:hypothetical protein